MSICWKSRFNIYSFKGLPSAFSLHIYLNIASSSKRCSSALMTCVKPVGLLTGTDIRYCRVVFEKSSNTGEIFRAYRLYSWLKIFIECCSKWLIVIAGINYENGWIKRMGFYFKSVLGVSLFIDNRFRDISSILLRLLSAMHGYSWNPVAWVNNGA